MRVVAPPVHRGPHLLFFRLFRMLRLFRLRDILKEKREDTTMSCPAFQDTESIMPKKHDIDLATQSSKEIAALLPKKHQDFRLFVREKQREVEITLPFSAVKMLLHILTQMSEGNAVTIIPIHAELSTQEAANLLNVSRPFLVQLLESGKIPFHKVGSHRRIYFRDLQAFKTKMDATSNQVLQDLAEQAQKLDMGY